MFIDNLIVYGQYTTISIIFGVNYKRQTLAEVKNPYLFVKKKSFPVIIMTWMLT